MGIHLLNILVITFLLCSCALITTPVKVVGKAATTTIGLTGKAVEAGYDAMNSDDQQESDEE